jgi:hypothetical protein
VSDQLRRDRGFDVPGASAPGNIADRSIILSHFSLLTSHFSVSTFAPFAVSNQSS